MYLETSLKYRTSRATHHKKMNLKKVVLFIVAIQLSCCQVTRRENVLLSRKKRYLMFPDGSNFVFTMVTVKLAMVNFPTRVHFLAEIDVPFKLPSDTRWYKRRRRIHRRQKRDIYSTLEVALNEHGFNGTSCVKRILCEAQSLIPNRGKSMVKDILATIFSYDDDKQQNNGIFSDFCAESVFTNCQISLLDFIIGSFTGNNK